jgi:hypothetical protein
MNETEANLKKRPVNNGVSPRVSRSTNRATMTVNRGVCVVGVAVVQMSSSYAAIVIAALPNSIGNGREPLVAATRR